MRDIIEREKITEVLRAVGCDVRYINREASDFELFDMWECILPMAASHRCVREYEQRMSILGIGAPAFGEYSRKKSCIRWRVINGGDLSTGEYSETNFNTKFDALLNKPNLKKVFDIRKIMSENINLCSEYDELSKAVNLSYSNCNLAETLLYISISGYEYARPDTYTARKAFKKKKSGEKCNSTEDFVLLSELVIELMKNYNISDLRISGFVESKCGAKLLSYLGDRNFFRGMVIADVTVRDDFSAFGRLCEGLYPDIKIYPLLVKKGISITENDLLNVFENYPVAAFYFDSDIDPNVIRAAVNKISDNREHSRELLRLLRAEL